MEKISGILRANDGLFLEIVVATIGILFFVTLEIITVPMFDDVDIAYQLGTVYAFLEGYGFSHVFSTSADDLSLLEYDAITQWPHAYPLFTSLVYLFTQDIILSRLVLQIFFIALFFVSMLSILRSLRSHLGLIARLGLLIFWMLFADPFRKPTEIMALSLLYASLACVLHGLKGDRSIVWVLLAGVLSGIAGMTRYIYITYIAIFPLIALVLALYYKKWSFLRDGILFVISAGGIVIANLLYNMRVAGTATRTDMVDGGLFWSNLLLAHPIGNSAVGTGRGWTYIADALQFDSSPLLWFFSCVIIALLIWMTYRTVHNWIEQRASHSLPASPDVVIVLFGFLLMLITMSVLIALSIINRPLPNPDGSYRTFITNERYYVPTAVWIAVIFALFLRNYANARTNMTRFLRRIVYFCLCFMLPGIILTGVLTMTTVRFRASTAGFYISEQQFGQAEAIFGALQRVDDEPSVVIAGTFFDPVKFRYLTILSGNILYTGELSRDTDFSSSTPITVLVAFPQGLSSDSDEFNALQNLLSTYESEKYDEIDGFLDFYRVSITP